MGISLEIMLYILSKCQLNVDETLKMYVGFYFVLSLSLSSIFCLFPVACRLIVARTADQRKSKHKVDIWKRRVSNYIMWYAQLVSNRWFVPCFAGFLISSHLTQTQTFEARAEQCVPLPLQTFQPYAGSSLGIRSTLATFYLFSFKHRQLKRNNHFFCSVSLATKMLPPIEWLMFVSSCSSFSFLIHQMRYISHTCIWSLALEQLQLCKR